MSSFVLFNPIKHHLTSILDLISQRIMSDDEALLKKELLKLGGSQMDLYTGRLSVNEIKLEVEDILKTQNCFEVSSFQKKLGEHGGFYSINLSDGSCWILRWGNESDEYIHIHPGRYSLHSFRVKASMLKTAIAVLICSKKDKVLINLSYVNIIRVNLLDLSPIKDYTLDDGIGKLIAYIDARLTYR